MSAAAGLVAAWPPVAHAGPSPLMQGRIDESALRDDHHKPADLPVVQSTKFELKRSVPRPWSPKEGAANRGRQKASEPVLS